MGGCVHYYVVISCVFATMYLMSTPSGIQTVKEGHPSVFLRNVLVILQISTIGHSFTLVNLAVLIALAHIKIDKNKKYL